MNLNRPLIKQQAKDLIRNNVFKLFVIQLAVMVCMGGIIYIGYGSVMNKFFSFVVPFTESIENNFYENSENFGIDDDFNHFGESGENDFYNFGSDAYSDNPDGHDFYNFGADNPEYDYYERVPYNTDDFFFEYAAFMVIFWLIYMLGMIAYVFLSPLEVSLSGLYVSFIRGQRFDAGSGISTVFRNAFKVNYGKKLGVVLLRGLCVYFLCWLFIIPGIIYYFSSYFAFQIMCDNPDISPSQALDVSKKMVKGNRWELFVMNLSFFPWFLLSSLCLGIPYIYVLPYFSATNALYYENFRIRALQEGRVTEDDFLSDAQRYAKYAQMYANSFNPQNQPYGNAQNPYYANQYPQNTAYGYTNAPQYAPNGNNQSYGNVNQPYNPYANPYQQPYNMNNAAPQPNYAPQNEGAAPVEQETAPIQETEQQPETEIPVQETAQEQIFEEPAVNEPPSDMPAEPESAAENDVTKS